MGLIYSQFEFNKSYKEVKEVFKQKLNDFKNKNFAKKCNFNPHCRNNRIGVGL